MWLVALFVCFCRNLLTNFQSGCTSLLSRWECTKLLLMTAILAGLRWYLQVLLLVISLMSKDIEYLLKYLPAASFESCLPRSRVHFVFLRFFAPWCYVFELIFLHQMYSWLNISPTLWGLSCSLIYYFSVLAFLLRCHSMEIPASCLILILSIQFWKPIISLISFIWLSSLTAKQMLEMNEVIIHKLWYKRVRIWALLYTWFSLQ